MLVGGAMKDNCISIHALRGEGDKNPSPIKQTPNISIHALRGEGDKFHARLPDKTCISIHALRGEGDNNC